MQIVIKLSKQVRNIFGPEAGRTMNLQQMSYVLEVYRQRSFSKAAKALFVTQPTLSISIKELEGELGFALFERHSKGVIPTSAGTAYIHAIQEAFTRLAGIHAQYTTRKGESNLILRVSTSRYSFVSDAVITFYTEELSQAEKYSISVEEQDCQQVIQDVLARKSEIGIIHTNEQSDKAQRAFFQEKQIAFCKLFESRPCLIFRKGHPLEMQQSVSRTDVMRYPQIRTTSQNSNFYDESANFNFEKYPDSGKNFFLNSRSMVYNLLNAPSPNDIVFLGVTGQRINAIHSHLCARPLAEGSMNYFYAITLKDQRLSQGGKCFLDILRRQAALRQQEQS